MISRTTAIATIAGLSNADLVTLANAALLAALEAKRNGYPGPNVRALCASVRTVIGLGDDIDG